MSIVTIWHNPHCSKSRQTLALLHENGVEPVERHYLTDPPDVAEIAAVLTALGLTPLELMREGEALFKELGINADLNDDALIKAMSKHPKLIERPIVFTDTNARIGRPPEKVLELF